MKRNIKSVTLYRQNTVATEGKNEFEKKSFKYNYTEFDESGQLLTELKFNEDGEIDEKIVNSYDDKGRLTEEITYLNEDEMAEHKAYEWDEKGHVAQAFKIYQDGERDTIHYKRDAEGKLVEKVTIDSYNEEEAREIIDYENGKVKQRKVFEYDELMLEETYEYDEKGSISEHSKWTIDDENARYFNSFDTKGHLIKTRRFNLKDQLISQAIYTYAGDQLMKIVEEDQYSTNTTTIVYNDKGDAVEQTEQNKAGEINNQALRKYNDNHDMIESEVWIDLHGKGINQHYILKYEYEYYN